MSTKKFLLQEKDIPTAWYNIVADMKTKPLPPLNPQTHEPMKEEDFYPLFAKELSHQEMNQTDAWIEIPEQVRDMYKIWRPTPLVRAYGLEKYLDTPAHIYFKNESVSPVGSHKLNSAIAQAYFCKPILQPRPEPVNGGRPSRLPPRLSGSNWPSTWSKSATTRNPTEGRSCRRSAHKSSLRPV